MTDLQQLQALLAAVTQHFDCGPSSFSRRIACSASYLLEKGLGSVSNVYARDGTLTHACSEALILLGIDPDSLVGQEVQVEGHTHVITDKIAKAAHFYVDAIHKLRRPGDVQFIEQWVDLSWIHPLIGGGSVDCGLSNMRQKLIQVCDLKAGTSPVKPDSVQFMLYALGMLGEHNELGYRRAELTVIQPNDKRKTIPKVRTHPISVSELYRWADKVARPTCERCLDPAEKPVKGKQCYFCKAKGNTCPLHEVYVPDDGKYFPIIRKKK